MIIDAQTRIWPSVDRLGRESADIARREQATRRIRESADPGQLELDLDPIDAAARLRLSLRAAGFDDRQRVDRRSRRPKPEPT